jgi:pyruvate/2-oxoacid:ferredoxin oxidoreductase alpha subunit
MKPQLTKGNEAIVKAAVLAGARAYYGYPITPASEIAEAAALYFPQGQYGEGYCICSCHCIGMGWLH